MFSSFDPNQKSILKKISEKFSTSASKLDCKLIYQFLGLRRQEPKVSHLTCGKFIEFKPLQNDKLHNFSSTSFFGDTSLNVIGHEIPRMPQCISPRSDRIQKLKAKEIQQRMYEKMGDERVKTPAEGFERLRAVVDSNEFPSWDNFLIGLEARAIELMLVEYDAVSLKLMDELEKLWSVWNSDYWTSFSDDKEECQYYGTKYTVFDGCPPWRQSHTYAFRSQVEALDSRFSVHLKIIGNFWSKFYSLLIFDWKQYFLGKTIISLEVIKLEIEAFLHRAKKICQTDWPLEICEILLSSATSWTSFLSDQDESNQFFDSIASLQASLLQRIIKENANSFIAELKAFSASNKTEIVWYEQTMDELFLWKLATQFDTLGEAIIRVENRLYPDLFPEKKYLKLEKIELRKDSKVKVEIQNPLLGLLEKFESVKIEAKALIDQDDPDSEKIIEVQKALFQLRNKLAETPRKTFTELYIFDFTHQADDLGDKIKVLLDSLEGKVNEIISEKSKRITDYYSISSKKLYGKDVFQQLDTLASVNSIDVAKLKTMFAEIQTHSSQLLETFDLTELTLLRYYQASRAAHRLAYLAKLVWERLQVDRSSIEKSVTEKSSVMFYEAEMLERELKICIKKYKLYPNNATVIRQLSMRFEEISLALNKLEGEFPILNNQLILLGMEPIIIDIPMLANQCRIFHAVSMVHAETLSCDEIYMNTKVQDVDCEDISTRLSKIHEKLSQITLILTSQPDETMKESLTDVVTKIETTTKTLTETLPLVKALKSEGMKQRHWENLLSEAETSEEVRDKLLVKDLVGLDLSEKAKKCEEIVVVAGKELNLEKSLEKMKAQWSEIEVQYDRSQGKRKFQVSPEILFLLEEHIIKTQMTLSSPFATNLAEDLKDWLLTLQQMQKVFELYKICDSKLIYLEPLFSTEDIAYQMPEEWRIYQAAIEKWNTLHLHLLSIKTYIDMVKLNFYQEFIQLFEMFKKIQIGFDAYLQKRKLNSPRLHFLSNNELLEMLSKGRNPKLVEPFLPKLFASISKPEFNNRGEIIAVYASNNERLEFHRPVNVNLAKRHVDKWLLELEKEMKLTIHYMIKKLLQKYEFEFGSLEKIIKEGVVDQAILAHFKLVFTHKTEDAIIHGKLESLLFELQTYTSQCLRYSPSNDRDLLLFQNIFVDLIEFQTIITHLLQTGVNSIEDIHWTGQFRYYWSNDNFFVRLFNLAMLYGYEYLAITKPFVKTDKVKLLHIQLAMFQHQNFGCLLQGPAATGKSETIKEFSKTLGRFCLSFNCSSQSSIEQLEDLIAGTFLSGTTLCLDEFNRLPSPTMTATINHILGVYQAKHSHNLYYYMHNLELAVHPLSAFFLSMNPGYVGRHPLPANTSAVTKIIDVPLADLKAIAEEYFLLAGFKVPKKCSLELISIFKQCSATVSPMRHYDFSLRTLLANVKNAVWLQNENSLLPETGITVKAAQNLLSSMFTLVDSKIFSKILLLSKSKPMITDAETAYKTAIQQICIDLKFDAKSNFVNACYNLYFLSRHHCAIILIGNILTGKTSTIKIVKALLKEKDQIDCHLQTIYPGLHTNEALFGKFDSQKLEWRRGILTELLASPINGTDERWIHIDGILDSLWIETLNSLLDDNQKLCLGNGETVMLHPQIRLIFETDDLSKVALSTISRCRVIYFDQTFIPPSTIASNLDDTVIQKAQSLLSTVPVLPITNEKLHYVRLKELYSLHDAFVPSDPELSLLLNTVAAMSIVPQDNFNFWFEASKILRLKLFSSFPQAFGQWMDLSIEGETEERFWRMFLKRLLRSSLMLVIFGKSGTGKTMFINELLADLDEQHWDLHVLSLSEETTADSLLQAILDCNLVRIHSNHFTGPNAKNVLIILDGLSRISQGKSFNCPFEFLRSFYADGKIIDNEGNEIQFTSIYFLAEFSTSIENPMKLEIPERLQKFFHPWFWNDNKGYSNPVNACHSFLRLFDTNPTDQRFRELAINELFEAADGADFSPFEAYATILKSLKAEVFTFQADKYLITWQEGGLWQTETLGSIRSELNRIIAKDKAKNPELSQILIHDNFTRHFCFILKTLQMPFFGHCIFIGAHENGLEEIIEVAAHLLGSQLEKLSIEITESYWKETLIKIARQCAIENRKTILLITDQIYSSKIFKQILSDLVVLMNSGMLPATIFSSSLLAEFKGGSLALKDGKDLTEWKQKELITQAIRRNLHVIFRVEKPTIEKYEKQFRQISNYSLVALMSWKEKELTSFATISLQKSLLFGSDEIPSLTNKLLNYFKFIQKHLPDLKPIKFLDFVKQYIHLVQEKKSSIELLEKRYKTGISKLEKANEQVNFLQQELLRLQPELVRTSLETTVLMSTIERETIEIENAREVVAANEFKANEAATKAQALKAECEHEVAEAIPALETAIDALQVLNQSDISTLKTMRFPPQGVRMCMEAVCILLGEKPVKITDSLGNVTVDYWITSQKVLSDIHFLSRIRTFPRDKVSSKTMRLIRSNYLSKPEFDAENMRQVSAAAEGLCFWVKAIDIYNKIAKVVEPKKDKLKKAELMVKQHMKQLEQRRKALQEVTERLQKLSDQFSHMSQRKQDLQNQIHNCELKMTRAEKLLQALENERGRWDSNLQNLKLEFESFKQNCLIGAVSVELLNDLDYDKRQEIISKLISNFRLPKTFNLKSILKHTSILLADRNERVSEPYVILGLTRKIPLIIDPQGESEKMLSHILAGTVITIDAHSPNLPATIVSAIGNGHILLVDNLREPLPLYLVQLIYPMLIKDGKDTLLQLNNKLFDFNSNFYLILRTEKQPKDFDSKILKSLCIINVSVGDNVIKNKLMEIFLQVNAFPLTSKRDQLMEEKANLLRQADAVEDGTLEALAKSKDLDDDRTIDLLGEVRVLAANLEEKIKELDEVEAQLETIKSKFIKVGDFGTTLVKASVNISKISTFYARTLRYYLEVFRKAVGLDSSLMSEEQIPQINQNVFGTFRRKISRSLFAEHRKIFEFLATCSVDNLSVLTERQFIKHYTSIKAEHSTNLRDQILQADSNLPIVLLLSEEADYVMKMLFYLAEQQLPIHINNRTPKKRRFIQLISAKDMPKFAWESALENDQWIVIQSCENLNVEENSDLLEIIQRIFESNLRKANFRLFVILYAGGEMTSHSLLDISTVITADDSRLNFRDFLIYVYTSLGPSRVHGNLKSYSQRQCLYKLCCFHFAVFERSRYGIFGFANNFKPSLANFESAVSLYGASLISIQSPTVEDLWEAVMIIAYHTSDPNDLKTLKIMAEWIFGGINKYDDRLLDGIWLRDYNESLSVIRAQLDSLPAIKNQALTGLSPTVTKLYRQHELRKIYQSIMDFENGTIEKAEVAPMEMVICKPVRYPEGCGEIERCIINEIQFLEETGIAPEKIPILQQLLSNTPIKKLNLNHLHRPEAIIETLKFIYSKRFKLPYDDIEVIGTLRKPQQSSEVLELSDCILLGGGFDPATNGLIESTRPFLKAHEFYVFPRRKVIKSATALMFPLLFQSNLDQSKWSSLCFVEIESTLPLNHWILRGVKFIITNQLQDLFGK